MPLQVRSPTSHARDCTCPACMTVYAIHMWARRKLDELAAADPEPNARAEFAAWVAQDPPVTCPEDMP